MKNKIKVFLRTTVIWCVVLFNIIFATLAVFKSYENIMHLGFGRYVKAVEADFEKRSIRILDFTINY